jgi:hypothetical protein
MKLSSFLLGLPLVSAAVLDTRQTLNRAGAPLDQPVATMRKDASRKYFTFGRKLTKISKMYTIN